jgi:hypothetical protein
MATVTDTICGFPQSPWGEFQAVTSQQVMSILNFSWKSEGNRLFGRTSHRWENMLDSTDSDRVQWPAFVNIIINV